MMMRKCTNLRCADGACLCALQGLLEAHESVAGHTLADLASCSDSAAAAELPTLLLIDTAGCNFDEQQEQDGDSRCVCSGRRRSIKWRPVLCLLGHELTTVESPS